MWLYIARPCSVLLPVFSATLKVALMSAKRSVPALGCFVLIHNAFVTIDGGRSGNPPVFVKIHPCMWEARRTAAGRLFTQ